MSLKYLNNYQRIFNFTRIFSKLCGADMVREDYRMNWITWSLIALVNFAIAFTFYTMYVGVIINNDWIEVMKCLCMFTTGIQAYAKLINGLKKQPLIPFLQREIIGIYTIYGQKSKKYHELLKESISLVKKLIAILSSILVLVILALIGTPIIYELIYHERTFIMPFFFPYIDYNTNFGYYLTSTFHVVCVFFGVSGNFLNDLWCFIFASHIALVKNVLQSKFNELDEFSGTVPKEINKIQDLLKDILRWHQKYIIFCKTVKDLFYWVIFVQVVMQFVSIVCTIVCIFLGVWPAAPVFLLYSLLLFYFYCALGNIVETANEDVIAMIYNSCWYNLNVTQQKMILVMLRESQQAEGISIGGIAPLSLSTALQMTKRIYTFSMMLKQFLNK